MQKLFKDDNGKVIYDTLLNDYNNYLDNNGSEYAILDRPIDNIYQNANNNFEMGYFMNKLKTMYYLITDTLNLKRLLISLKKQLRTTK